MPTRALRFCRHPGCVALVNGSAQYCENHIADQREREASSDRRRGSAYSRGYGRKWASYSRAFLRQPGNQFCCLRLDDRCTIVADCVDHIDPPDSANDPRFWDKSNHQPACIHCNSVKGHRKLKGTYHFGEGVI